MGKRNTHLSLPSPPTMIRLLSPSQAKSLMRPPMGLIASFSPFSAWVMSHILTFPAISPEAA